MEDKDLSLKEKIDILFAEKVETKKKKRKLFKIPKRGVPSKSKVKKGYMIVVRIDDNKNIDFEKQPLEDSTFRLKDKTYHSLTKEEDIFFYKQKPLIFQAVKKREPYNPELTDENPLKGANETYGQKYIMARMLKDAIKIKKSLGGWVIWIVLAIVGFFVVQYFMKKGSL